RRSTAPAAHAPPRAQTAEPRAGHAAHPRTSDSHAASRSAHQRPTRDPPRPTADPPRPRHNHPGSASQPPLEQRKRPGHWPGPTTPEPGDESSVVRPSELLSAATSLTVALLIALTQAVR